MSIQPWPHFLQSLNLCVEPGRVKYGAPKNLVPVVTIFSLRPMNAMSGLMVDAGE